MAELSFFLNGRQTTVEYREGMNLLEVLRHCCGVVSPKDGCAPQGVCGCCTSLIDGKPVPVCLRKPEQVAGKHVTTLEGLDPERRKLLAEAFVKEGAVQCGYCTPGIVMRTSALIDKGKSDRDEIARALSGHLCRCTGYARILDACCTAVEAAQNGGRVEAGEPRRAEAVRRLDAKAKKDGIGSSSRRYRGVDHSFGEKLYVADMTLADLKADELREDAAAGPLLHGALVFSQHPRAVVRKIDTTAATAHDGVARVLTAADVPGDRIVGLIRKDWPIFVAEGETTRCVGDVLAMVVAESPFEARRAAGLVTVDYQVLEPVHDPEEALDAGAPALHDDLGGNLLDTCSFARGDVDGALAEAAHVVSGRYVTQRIEHAFLEPEACLAAPTDDGLKVYSQGQGVHDDQRQIAAVLGWETSKVEVELVTNGGAFGGKEDLSVQAQTSLAAHLLGRPVRCVLSREESLRLHPKRHPLTMEYTLAADADGHLTALRARMIGDTGAYASVGMKVLERAAGHSCGPYRVPAVDVVAKTVHTNNPPCGAMRGFGVNQTSFAVESLMDQLAEKVGVDGYDIRRRNVLAPGDLFATGQRMTESCGILQTLEAVKDVYKETRAGGGFVGIGCGIKNTGIGNGMDDSGRLLIRVLEGGRLEILTGYTEMGQGLFTILRQVVCEETGLDPELMDVRTASDPRVLCGMTTASRATALLTEAGRRAALDLKQALDGAELGALTGREFLGEFICDFTTKPGKTEPGKGKEGEEGEDPKTHMTFSYATQVVILDEAGKLSKVVAAHDVGRAINPLQCAGQIEGSVHMGLGYALSEDFPCSDGHPESLLLRDVGLLKAKDTPEVEVILVEVPDEVGGYGSKGVGEIGLVPTAGAVAGALYAFDGERRYRLPMVEASAAQGLVPKARSPYRPEDSGGPELTGRGPFALEVAR